EDGIRGDPVTGVQTCALPIYCRPEWLVQFAIMASLYAQHVLGTQNPRVAVLSNGEEEGKGNTLVKETAELLSHMSRSSMNFIGKIGRASCRERGGKRSASGHV